MIIEAFALIISDRYSGSVYTSSRSIDLIYVQLALSEKNNPLLTHTGN